MTSTPNGHPTPPASSSPLSSLPCSCRLASTSTIGMLYHRSRRIIKMPIHLCDTNLCPPSFHSLFHAYGRKFLYSILCFGFCMARCAALAVRIAITQHQTNTALNIIGQILLAAGVLLLVGTYMALCLHPIDPSLVYCSSPNEPTLLRTTAPSSFHRSQTFCSWRLLASSMYLSDE